MKILKQILVYLTWTVIALLVGICYARIILGSNEIAAEGWGYLAHLFYVHGLLYIGLIVGAIIALLFILLDVFYLKKKLKNNIKSTSIRFLFLLVITIVVGVIHYILEKVVDVI